MAHWLSQSWVFVKHRLETLRFNQGPHTVAVTPNRFGASAVLKDLHDVSLQRVGP